MEKAQSEHLAGLRVAIRIGVDDIGGGRYESVDDPGVWVDEITKGVTA